MYDPEVYDLSKNINQKQVFVWAGHCLVLVGQHKHTLLQITVR